MKRTLSIFLVICAILACTSCGTSGGEEIAGFSYSLDDGSGKENYTYNKGLSDLMSLVNGVYDVPGDINEIGRPISQPIVEFDDGVCMFADGVEFPTRMYYYFGCELKYTEIAQSYDFAIKAEDTEEYWNSYDVDTYKTIRQVVEEKVFEVVRDIMACEISYKDYGLELSDSWVLSYENAVNSVFGSEQALEEYYSAFGLNAALLEDYYRRIALYNELYERMVGIDGILYPTIDESKQFFRDECLYIEQIVFPYVDINESGHNVLKSAEEIEASRKKGQELYSLIEADPEQFSRNMYKTEHPEWSENRLGYIYTPESVIPEILNACLETEIGTIFAIDTPIGYYIIRNLEKTDSAFEMGASKIITSHCDKIFKTELSKYYDKISVDNAEIEKYKFEEMLVLK